MAKRSITEVRVISILRSCLNSFSHTDGKPWLGLLVLLNHSQYGFYHLGGTMKGLSSTSMQPSFHGQIETSSIAWNSAVSEIQVLVMQGILCIMSKSLQIWSWNVLLQHLEPSVTWRWYLLEVDSKFDHHTEDSVASHSCLVLSEVDSDTEGIWVSKTSARH